MDGDDGNSDVKSVKSVKGSNVKTNKDKDNKELKEHQEDKEVNDTIREIKDHREKRQKMREKNKITDGASVLDKIPDISENTRKDEDSLPEVREERGTLFKKSSTSPVRSLRPGSGGMPRYPGGILHNRDPLYSYHRREKRRVSLQFVIY